MDETGTRVLLVLIIQVAIIVAVIVVIVRLFRLWLRAALSNAHASFPSLVGMTLRKVNLEIIVNARVMATTAGLKVTTNELEAHYLANGDVVRVVQAMVEANKANIELPFETAAAIDLAGRDVLEEVLTRVNQMVIDVSNPREQKSGANRNCEDPHKQWS